MDILKNFAAAMDRQIERRRIMKEADKLETLEQRKAWIEANRERLLATFRFVPPPSYLDWDNEPSGYEGVTNGEMGS